MSKYCPIAKQHTNCTDNCASCMADDKRYVVKAYICTNFSGLMASLETDIFSEVEDFIWENVQRGYNCELTDKERGETNWAYADDFDEEALNPEDLIRDHKKPSKNDFYTDLYGAARTNVRGGTKMKLYISLNRDEIQERIPYAIVAETMSGAVWNTSKRKRLMKKYFTESEIGVIYRLHKQAYAWYLRTGVPDEVKMTFNTYSLWQKLANFCCEI